MHSKVEKFPVFTANKDSKKLAIRVRVAYKLILRIIKCAKEKRVRKASMLCAKLNNINVLHYVPQTRVFADLVSYHTGSGKLRKNSYRILLRSAGKPLFELESHIKSSDFLIKAAPTTAKTIITGKKIVQQPKLKEKPKFSFNALEDLESIKKLVVEKKEETVESIVASVVKAKKQAKAEADTMPVKKAKKVKEVEPETYTAKSVTKDDSLVIKTLSKEKSDVDIEVGECKIIKRGVVMLGTLIPNIMWKKVCTQLGLQLVAKQYITAIYAPIIASPAELDGEALESMEILNHANQLVALYNKKQSDPCMKLSIIGNPFSIGNSSHWWYLCLPQCVTDHPSFRFGSWHFTKPPKAKTAHAAQLV